MQPVKVKAIPNESKHRCSAYRSDEEDGCPGAPDRLGELAIAGEVKEASRRVRVDWPGEVVPDLGDPGSDGKEWLEREGALGKALWEVVGFYVYLCGVFQT